MTILKRVPWLHFLLLAVLAGVLIWYLADNYGASSRFTNLLFVVPVGMVGLGLILLVVIGVLINIRDDARDSGEKEWAEAGEKVGKVQPSTVAMMVLFAAYAISAEYIGFDLASFLFIFCALLLNGERRWFFLIVFPAIFTAILTWLFRFGVPVPLPTLLPW